MEWISVEDRLPETNLPLHVLIAAKRPEGNLYVSCTSYLPAYGGFDHYHYQVTHWMPLPEPPDDD